MATLEEVAARAAELVNRDHGLDGVADSGEFFSDPRLFDPWFQAQRSITLGTIARQTGLVRPGEEDLVAAGEGLLQRAEQEVGTVGLTGSRGGTRRRRREVGLLGAITEVSEVAQVLAPGIEAGVNAALAVQQAIAGPSALVPFVAPGGALTLPTASALTLLGGAGADIFGRAAQLGIPAGGFGTDVFELLQQVPGGAPGGQVSPGGMFKATPGGFRARHTVEADNPITGKRSWWINRGRPMLWSGDLGACKRVSKAARRARRARPR